MKNILVTGAAGFIGFHLSLALKKRNDFVIGLDNFNSYYSVELKKQRADILKNRGIEVIKADINEQNILEKIIKENEITHVVNLAAQAGVRYSLENPKAYIDSNIVGFTSILEVLKNFSHIKLIFASSSSVYGLNEKVPFSVGDRTDMPANLYAATKKANEAIAYSYHSIFKIPCVGLRYFTVYGPFGRPDMAYFNFTKNILAKKPINIFNNGKMKRDFTYIDDAVAGTIAAIDYCKDFEIFNIGNNKTVDLLDFIKTLEQNLNKEAIKINLPMQKGEMLKTFADITKSQRILNFSPKTSIEEGLKKFTTWYLDFFKVSL